MTRSTIRVWLTTLLFLGSGTVASTQIYPTAVVTISGSQTGTANGTMTIGFNGYSETVPYGQYSTASSIASAFAAEFSSYPASAWPRLCTIGVCAKATGSIITFQLKTVTSYGSFNFSCTGACPFQASVTSTQARPVIVWSPPAAINAGTALSATQLDATAAIAATGASVAGTFSYSPAAGTVLPAGSQNLQVTFMPNDTVDFTQATASVTLAVNQLTPTISISDIPLNAKIGGSFTVSYNYSGNGSLSVVSSTTGVCTASGNVVSFVKIGRCILQATATATTNYAAATGSEQSFTVSPIGIALPSPGYIETIAGNGTAGHSGDAGAATSAEINAPPAVAVDSAGNIYIADSNEIRMVSASTGDISTVAGNGTPGYSGDGGLAISAELYAASGVAVDSAGNLYIADEINNRVRMVNASTGVITTVAGNGATGNTGIGGSYSGDGEPATSAALNGPTKVFVDSAGNIYFIDYYNDRVRKVTASTGVISTVAGIGTQGYSGDGGLATSAALNFPMAIAVDNTGNLYIADTFNNRIRMVSTSTGIISTIAGNGATGYSGEGDGGAATSAVLNIPIGVSLDSAGNLYIADSFSQRIRMVMASTGIISTIGGNGTQGYSGDGGPAISAELNDPAGIALDSAGNIYIADGQNNVIRAIGAFLPTANVSISCNPAAITYGAQATCIATVTGSSPTGTVTFTYNGDSWTSCPLSNGSCSVSGLSSVGGGFYTVIGNYSGDGNNSVASGSTSLTIYETTRSNGPATPTITIINMPLSGTIGDSFTAVYSYSGDESPTESVSSSTPGVCTVSGNLVSFVGVGTCTLQSSVTATTDYTAATGSAQSFTVSAIKAGIVLPSMGNINTIAGNGSAGYSGDGGPAISGELKDPAGVALDSEGNVYIADALNSRIRLVTASTGVISTIAGNGAVDTNSAYSYGSYSGDGGPAISAALNYPMGVAVDSAGNIYIADALNGRIRVVTASTGVISTIAGNGALEDNPYYPGVGSYSGDGGPAISAALNYPMGVAVDSAGNIYIADTYNGRIRKVTAATSIISTVVGNGAGNYSGYGGAYSGDGGPATNAALFEPTGVAVDLAGNLYIADSVNARIRKVTASTGIISTIAGNGTPGYAGDGGFATKAELGYITGVAVDNAGNIYIADPNRIRMVTASTGIISTITGNGSGGYSGDGGPATSATLNGPIGIAVDSTGNIYIGDQYNSRVRAIGARMPAAHVSISCSPSTIVHGAPTTCTATVTGSSPSGTMTFSYNDIFWASCTLSSGSCAVSGLSGVVGGFYAIAGSYSGDGNNAAGSGATGLTISPATPTISVASSGSPSTYGVPVTFTATVTVNDTNAVSFYSGGTLLGTATPANGAAALTTSSLPVGSNVITASIAPGEDYNGATFGTITQTVTAAGQSDTGTVALQVNGSVVAQTTYGAGSTSGSIAHDLAAAASSALVKVSAVDNSLYIESLASGAGITYPYSLVISDTAGLAPSFSASPSSGNLQGVTAGGTGTGQTIYSYCVSGASNTCNTSNAGYDAAGNLLGYSDSVMGTWSFGYDSLNRLISGTPATGNTSNGVQSLCWSYDSFGNRTAQSAQSGPCPTLPSLPQQTATYNSNNQVTWTSVKAAANGFLYDAAGNVFNDNVNTYLHDGEGRICAVMSAPAPGMRIMTGYLYDAEGTRVAKGTITSMSCDPAVNGFQSTSDYVLDLSGEQVTEVGVNANGTLAHQHTNVWAGGKLLGTYDDDGLHFYLDDPLGTRRVQTNFAGIIEQQCVSFPFGDGETCTTTPTEHLFTGKERDSESGLDYFGARYYASSMGRWMSPDWSAIQQPVPYANLTDPQSLNLYEYVRNNPFSITDADGHGWWQKFKNLFSDASCWCEGAEADQRAAAFRQARANLGKPMSQDDKQQLATFVTVTVLYNAADSVAGSSAGDDETGEIEGGLAAQEIPTIGGRKPINSGLAGGTHPAEVDFSEQGFPKFGPHSVAEVQIDGLTGNYAKDSAMANQAVGLSSTPKGYVWHHVEDGKTMQLVPQDIHSQVGHTGGAAVIRNGGLDKP